MESFHVGCCYFYPLNFSFGSKSLSKDKQKYDYGDEGD